MLKQNLKVWLKTKKKTLNLSDPITKDKKNQLN